MQKEEQKPERQQKHTHKAKRQTIVLTKDQHRRIEQNSESKLQAFQRKIYLKAKQNPKYKFYCLYDKVTRTDVIKKAYERVKANDGAPGIDNLTFYELEKEKKEEAFLNQIQKELKDQMYTPERLREVKIPKGTSKTKTRTLKIPTIKDRVVQMAVKLIIEPIFEADFKEHSYGYRPKKNAHQAIAKLDKSLFPDIYKPTQRQKDICSIDLSDCFDTIPQNELIHLIAKRIIDRKLLGLIKTIIRAGAIKPSRKKGNDDNNETNDCNQKNNTGTGRRGTPQGGVLSPLLANIYLDRLDDFWETRDTESLMLRYADDMVILLNKEDEENYQTFLNYTENELKLTINKEKTTKTTIREGFDFLGFTLRQKTSRRKKQYLSIEPNKKSLKRIREKLRGTIRWTNKGSNQQIIDRTNTILKGWQYYFDNITMGRTRERIKWMTELRVAKFLSRRGKKRSKAVWKHFDKKRLYTEHGLYELKSLGRIFA